jgi:hypothetical protein
MLQGKLHQGVREDPGQQGDGRKSNAGAGCLVDVYR